MAFAERERGCVEILTGARERGDAEWFGVAALDVEDGRRIGHDYSPIIRRPAGASQATYFRLHFHTSYTAFSPINVIHLQHSRSGSSTTAMPYRAADTESIYPESVFSLEVLEPSPVDDSPYENEKSYFPDDAVPEDPPPKLPAHSATLGLSGRGPVYYCKYFVPTLRNPFFSSYVSYISISLLLSCELHISTTSLSLTTTMRPNSCFLHSDVGLQQHCPLDT